MSKVVGFVIGAALVVAGVLTGNVGLIIQGGAMIVTQAIVDLTAPKVPARQASEMTLQLGEQPRCAQFGETFTPGSLVDGFNYGGKYGTDWEVLIIRLADHKCEGLSYFFVNDEKVQYVGNGNYPQFNGKHYEHLHVFFRADTNVDTFPSEITDNWPGWEASDVGESGCDIAVAYRCDTPKSKNPIWPGGRPRFGFVIKGKQCYDPRKDDTVPGGAGAHRWDDPMTWEWSENAVICWYNYERGIYANDDTSDPTALLVGRGLTAEESPPENIFAAANLCDEIAAAAHPYQTRTTALSSASFYFSPLTPYMARATTYGAIEWWTTNGYLNLGTSPSPGVAVGSVANTAVASDGTAYQVGTALSFGSPTYLITTPLLGTPVLTLTDAISINMGRTVVLENGVDTFVLTAYAAAPGYLDYATHVTHSQSLRDACIDADGNVAKLFQPTGSSADFTIECAGGTFTITGAAARSGPTAAGICYSAPYGQLCVFSDGYFYAIDPATGAERSRTALAGSAIIFETDPNQSTFWTLASPYNQYSLEDGSLIRSLNKGDWLVNSDGGARFDPFNDAVWSTAVTDVIIRELDRHGGYRVAGPVYSNQEFLDVEQMFAAATAGNIITHEGQVLLEPGQAKSVVASFTDDDLLSGGQVSWNQGFLSESNAEWVNTVVVQYVEPDQKWNSHAAPVMRETADIVADGKPREAQITLRLVRYQAQALRVAEINRRLGRLWGRATVKLGPRFCEIEEGDWVSWQSDRYFGGSAKIFQVQAYSIDAKWQPQLTLREISASVYADDAVFPVDQSRHGGGALPPPDVGSPEPANWVLAAVTLSDGGVSIPALELTGSAADDTGVEEIIVEYWKDDGVTDPVTNPDDPAWITEGSHAPTTTKVDITSIQGGQDYYVAVTYVVDGISGDRLVLGPATAGSVDVSGQVNPLITASINGLSWKQEVRAATTAAGTLATSFAAGQTIDGVVLAAGDRILVKNQAAQAENGLYVVAASGTPTRAADADAGAELVNATVYVSEGTTLADTQWTCTTNAPITVGTTGLTFAQSGGGASLTIKDDGATLTSSPISMDFTGAGVTATDDGVGNVSVNIPGGGGGGGTGSWALIGSYTPAAVASVDVTGLGGYDEVLVIARALTATISGVRRIQVSTDNGASFDGTAANYKKVDSNGVESNAATPAIAYHGANSGASRTLVAHIKNLKGDVKECAFQGVDTNILYVGSVDPINALRFDNHSGGTISGGPIDVFAR